MKRPYRRTSFRPSHSTFTRYVLIKHGSVPVEQRCYYTGDHSSRKAMWTRDKRQALLYADLNLVLFDLMILQRGDLPEGRRGVVGWEPSAENEASPESWESE